MQIGLQRKEGIIMDNVKKAPTLGFSVITLVVLVLFIAILIAIAKAPIVVVMMFAWLLLIPFARHLGYSNDEIEHHAYDLIKIGVGLLALMIAIGAMISIWLCAGTVPTLIYWGLLIISPKMFLLVAFIVTSLVAMPTGTSWGTVATAGVAMMGVGLGLGIPAGMVAGAIVSGAYFGDKFSPISDGPIFTATVCEVPLMTHIKHMAPTTFIAWGLAAIVYMFLGIKYAGTTLDLAAVDGLKTALIGLFNIGWITIIPMIVVIAMLIFKYSALWSILIGCVVGILVSVFYQGYGLGEVLTFMSKGFSIQTDNAILASLLNRGGMASMYELLAVIVGSLGMGGILKGTGMLDVIVSSMGKSLKGVRSLTLTTTIATAVATALVGTYYFAMVFVGTLMTPLFKKNRIKPENASRIINDFANCGVVFVPWNIGAIYMATTLGVPILQIMPWVLFSLFLFAADIIFGLFNINITKYNDEEWAQLQAEEAAATAKLEAAEAATV